MPPGILRGIYPVACFRAVPVWARRFTATLPWVQDRCRGTRESRASLLWIYAVFMESEGMETIVAEDVHTLHHSWSADPGKVALVGLLPRKTCGSRNNNQ